MKNKFVPPCPLTTPVLFLIFNRPDTTQKVFNTIRQAKPTQLFIAADGPRPDKEGEKEKCEQAREIIKQIDWDCEVKTLFRDKNLGCKIAVSSAIDWFFENVEEGIILEDDCLPSQSFFWFCQELLSKCKYDTRVLHIGGTNPIGLINTSNTYYFSKYNRIWGWATWKRAWKYFDYKIKYWPELKKDKIHYYYFNHKEAKYWENIWDKIYENKIDTWDYQWFLCRLIQGKAIIPSVNLVSNIGFNNYATHTKNLVNSLANLPRGEIIFPLVHPIHMVENKKKDELWSKNILGNKLLIDRIKNRLSFLKRIFKK
jgi:hypothetical protein